jgi:tetratricopeptide (TPR) repeat protein
MFVTVSSGLNRVYKFNQIVYEVLAQLDFGDTENRKKMHERLSQHFLNKKDSSNALEHMFKSGNTEEFIKILEVSIREMAAIGRGDLLIKWAEFSADNSPSGELMKKTIKVVGHLVNLELDKAEAIATEIEYASMHNEQLAFLKQLTSMIFAHVYFTRGEFARSLEMIDRAIDDKSPYPSIENTDRIALLRIKASIHFYTTNRMKLLSHSIGHAH